MVAIINASKSLRNALHYNEHKVKQGVAKLIHSNNFVKETEHLGMTDKLRTLQRLAQRNTRTQVNSIHISLNFDPSEKLSKALLQQIADTYMTKIGFGKQPYLVYQHEDAGHPHIHLVTTNIKQDSTRIKLHNIGRNQSEKARKEIEKDFKLVKAQRLELKHTYELKPVSIQKIQYGKSETKRAISNVLDTILPNYKYTSLAELNAILRLYNVIADRGGEESRTFKTKGLVYRILNDKGEQVGVPIKASHIYNKPGLKLLEQQFVANNKLRQPHKQRVRNSVDFALARHPGQSLDTLANSLKKDRIQLILRQNAQGLVYGITYVDHTSKCVFNGSDLGKSYSANALRERCDPKQVLMQELKQSQSIPSNQEPAPLLSGKLGEILNDLLQPEEHNQMIASELRQEELRKRKRKRLHH